MAGLGLLGGIAQGLGTGMLAGAKLDAEQAAEDLKWERTKAELALKYKIEERRAAADEAKSANDSRRLDLMERGILAKEQGGGRSGRGSGGGDAGIDLNTPEGRDAAARMIGITGPEAATAIDYQRRGALNPGLLEANTGTSLENFQDVNAAQTAEDKLTAKVGPGLLRSAQAMQQVTYGKDLPNVVEGQVASDLAAGTRKPLDVNASQAAMKGEAVKVVPADARMQDVSGDVVGKKNPQTFAPKTPEGEKPETPAEAKMKENTARRGAQLAAQELARKGLVRKPLDPKEKDIPVSADLQAHADLLSQYGLSAGQIGSVLGATERDKSGRFVNRNLIRNKKTGRIGYLIGNKFYPVE